MIITIDGPIATGKSTIAKKLAEEIGFIYFDTGAMFRSLTYAILRDKVDFHNPEILEEYLDKFDFDVVIELGNKKYFVGNEDVTLQIRSEPVTTLVSEISAIGMVREKMKEVQREFAIGVNAVFEGRDMGTTVFPYAEIKIFLTGRPEVRAKRRFDELKMKFPEETKDLTLEKTLEEISRRDTYDSTRKISPLRQAENAFVIDTSDLSTDEIVFKILEYRDTVSIEEGR